MSALSDALNKQGLALLAKGNHPRAIEFFLTAIAAEPMMADAHTNLGVCQFMRRECYEAIISFNRSLAIRPDHAETLLNLGYAHWRLNDLPAAIVAFERAIQLADLPLAHIGLGSVCWEDGDAERAIHHCRIGLEREPDNVLAHDTLREVYSYRGNEADALAACDSMIALSDDPKHAHKKSMIMLTYDDPAGWEAHECRYDAIDGLPQIVSENARWFARLFGKRWDGKPTGHLVVATEQGYGDVIQFLRYLPMVAQRCDKLTVHIPETLRRLVSQSFDIPNMTLDPEFPEKLDAYCLIMSLAYLLDATEPPGSPYLVASRTKYDEVRSLDGFKIGLAWAGSEAHPDNRWRTMPFGLMARLLSLPARFFSLQFPCEVDLTDDRITVVQPTRTMCSGKLSIDWTETAALIDTLDMVVSVDTAVAHLAGAMGKPVWMLNRHNTDWRWGLGRSDTPWYPTMRIFRQPRMGAWEPVIEEVYRKLAGMLKSGTPGSPV